MYYEETIIDGILHSRTHHAAEYMPYTAEALTRRYTKMKKDLQALQSDGRVRDVDEDAFVDQTIAMGKLHTHIAKLQFENECMLKRLANNTTAAIALYEAVAKDVVMEGVH